jgi:acyl carrier protein
MADNDDPRPPADAGETVARVLADILYLEPSAIGPDDLLTELGLDSILVVDFCAALTEQTGTRVTAATVYELGTPGRVAQHLAAARAR